MTQKSFVFVNVKNSPYIYSVVSKEYFDRLSPRLNSAPPALYKNSEFSEYSCPFTFTTLTENLPFKITEQGGFSLNAKGAPALDLAFLQFHKECLGIYQKFELSFDRLWFDYILDAKEYSEEFKKCYDSFLELNFPGGV